MSVYIPRFWRTVAPGWPRSVFQDGVEIEPVTFKGHDLCIPGSTIVSAHGPVESVRLACRELSRDLGIAYAHEVSGSILSFQLAQRKGQERSTSSPAIFL